MATNLVDTLANYALKYGLWTDTDPSKKIIQRDNEGKVAKIDYGQAAKNFGVSTLNAADFLGNIFLKPSDRVASNTNNETLTEARNNARKVARNMGWIGKGIDLAFGVSDATRLSGSASKTGKFKTDFLNGLSVFVPFSGAFGKNAGEYFENDNVNRTSYATIGNQARLHSKGNFWSGGEEIAQGIDMANLQTHIVDKNILEPTKRDLHSSMNDMWNTDVNFKVRQGGWDYNNAYHVANSKNGSVLQFTRHTLSKHKIKKRQSGGKVSIDYINPSVYKEGGKVNVIPEGALHKNKHHLEDVDEKFGSGSITTKGIPVIVESEGGEVIQQAEVEREEIILRLEVTKKLEELSKKHTDEAAIAAGKLLVKEILYNTIDNTNNMI